MDRAIVETEAMVAAGALVPPGKVVKSRQLWAGRPARYVRDLSDDEVAFLLKSATHYQGLAAEHASS
jgi:carbonic anhydrase/acetyltransferase-like protein (isoleucine patch superfamily)